MHSSSVRAELHTGTVQSTDGTLISFERCGDGPPLILVVGAFNERSTGAPLAQYLAPNHTVFTYDRRGRGQSSDTAPYAIEREPHELLPAIPPSVACAEVETSTGNHRPCGLSAALSASSTSPGCTSAVERVLSKVTMRFKYLE